jgi:multidrug efflux pump subunit AcrB
MKLETLIKKPVSVFLVTAALLLAGLLQLTNLPIKLYPNTNKTRISVRIPHPSMTAEVFEAEFSQIMVDEV